METFEQLEQMGHEQVIFCSNKESGLKAIIAIHNTTLGPALGGTRITHQLKLHLKMCSDFREV